MRKINLGLYCYLENSAVSYYRWYGVIKELCKVTDDINVIEVQDAQWCTLSGLDAVFLSKPYMKNLKLNDGRTADHEVVMNIIQNNNKKLIVDYDDLLSEIPEDSNFHKQNIEYDYKSNFLKFINMADGVIFSTRYMSDYLKDNQHLKHDNYTIINNAFNDYIFDLSYDNFSNYNKTILWRGCSTHFPDFENYIDNLIEVIKDNKDFTFIFLGICPDRRLQSLSNTKIINKSIDVIEYHYYIKTIKPSMVFVPLTDNHFNRSKSNCSKLEATFAGAITLSPRFEEFDWNHESDIEYFTPETFGSQIDSALDLIRKKDPIIKQLYEYNVDYIKEKYLLSNINKKRASFIKDIVLNRG